MSNLLTAQQEVITDLVVENKKLKQELEEAQLCLKKAITELDLASVEIFKWERDFMTVVHGFKAVVKQLNK
jgi:hypothetical protein